MNKSKLLDANLKESQRMLPAANLLFRIPDERIKILDFQIEALDVIAIDLYSLHMSSGNYVIDKNFNHKLISFFNMQKDFWNEPEKFDPERFLQKDFSFDNVTDSGNELLFLPFGSGKYLLNFRT